MQQPAYHIDTKLEGPAQLSASKISLSQFRNYHNLRVLVDQDPVVLTGANGGGKTNLLEALSLLVPGRGMRRAALADLQNNASHEPWAVAVELQTATGPLTVGTGRDVNESGLERRLIHIEGKNIRQQSVLSEHVAMAWITPDMDRTLAEGSSSRRKLLDRLVYSFEPTHHARMHRYEKALRERLRLLREGPCDATWLKALEDDMAQTAVAIAAARKHMIRQLRSAVAETSSAFPHADLKIKGIAEEALDEQPALLVEDKLRAAFFRTRGEDAQSGTCTTGIHRSDMLVTHREKKCPADLCSTGEQKALLIAIMLAYVRILIQSRSMAPLFLLDDIVSHLDSYRREALFDEITSLKVQAWLTGTDASSFAPLLSHAQHLHVEQGSLRSM